MPYNKSTRHIFYVQQNKVKTAVTAPKGILLSKAIEGFMLACRARQLSEHTIADYSHTFKIFQAHVGDIVMANIQPAQVNAFMAAQKVSAKTVLNYHIGLSALWTWAVRDGYVPKHIMRSVDAPRPRQIVIHPLSEIEVKAMFNGLRTNAVDLMRLKVNL